MAFFGFLKNKNEKGATIVVVAILLTVLLGFTALAIDVFNLIVVKNELQNAADAGALAGVMKLFDTADSTKISEDANKIGKEAAENNLSLKTIVEVDWQTGTNGPDVVRGHYNPKTKLFTANKNLNQAPIVDANNNFLPKDELYSNQNFINALKVTSWRGKSNNLDSLRITSFFARIFGYKDFGMKAEAVAFIDFAGTIAVGEIDLPMAICEDSILTSSGDYSCGQGRLINSAEKVDSETGFWTMYTDDNYNAAVFSKDPYDKFACKVANPYTLTLGDIMGTTSGQTNLLDVMACCGEFSGFDNKYCKAFESKDGESLVAESRTEPWKVTLPVIDCNSNPNYKKLVGAVTMEIILVTNTPAIFEDLPNTMGNSETGIWTKDSSKSPEDNWRSFVDHFDLRIRYRDGDSYRDALAYEVPGIKNLGLLNKTVYALPGCEKQEIKGGPGGPNWGVFSTTPVLVPFIES